MLRVNFRCAHPCRTFGRQRANDIWNKQRRAMQGMLIL